jgi:hypothetical protein
VRSIPGVLLSLLLFTATAASGQSLVVQGSAGPTMSDRGYSLSAGVGFSPGSRLTLLFGVDQSQLSSRFTSDGRGGGSAFRGGRITFASAEARGYLLGRDRVSPYLLGGIGAGVSRPTVNDRFPDRVTNDVRAVFFGGGIHIPVGDRLSVFADARLVTGAEAGELLALLPVRGGIAWRF